MTLPDVNLDNRKFQQIVDEAKLQIPDKFPEWTNHNVSDPGVALIELFAWMTEMTLYRLNQVPERALRALLNAVGFQMLPPRAARVDLTFLLAGPATKTEVIGEGTTVGTGGNSESQAIFETEDALELVPPQHVRTVVATAQRNVFRRMAQVGVFDDENGLVCFEGLTDAWADWNRSLGSLTEPQRQHWRPRQPFDGDAVYFAFARSLARAVLRADIGIDPRYPGLGSDPATPPVVWEASTSGGWASCVVHDQTSGLNRSGTVEIQVPAGHVAVAVEGQGTDLCWLRARVNVGGRPMYRTSPTMTRISFSTVGGVARARHAERQPREHLGLASGKPGQTFVLRRAPVIERKATEHILVDGEPWREVPDFRDCRPDDNVYRLDAATGEIAFGPLVHGVHGPVQHGKVPSAGVRVEMSGYRVGGGVRGNRLAHQITHLRSAPKNVKGVDNRVPSLGGAEAETIGEALARAPIALRAGDRAVTADDYVRLVCDVEPRLHRVDVRRPAKAGLPMRLLLVPKVEELVAPRLQEIDDYVLSRDLCDRLRAHLDPRRMVGANVVLTTPNYEGISVVVRVRPSAPTDPDSLPGDNRGAINLRVLETLYRFINPVVGGEDGKGLGYGESMTTERVEEVVGAVDGVDGVVETALFSVNLRQRSRVGKRRSLITSDADTIFLSHEHLVIVDQPEIGR